MPKRKFTVPSSGSTTQRSPPRGAPASICPCATCVWSSSSPTNSSPGRSRAISARIRRCASMSASETRSVGVLLVRTAPVALARKRSSSAPPASLAAATATSSSAAALCSLKARRALVGPIAGGLDLIGQGAGLRLAVGRWDQLHRKRQPALREPHGQRRRGLAGHVPGRGIGDGRGGEGERVEEAAALAARDRRRRLGRDGREQKVKALEGHIDALRIALLLLTRKRVIAHPAQKAHREVELRRDRAVRKPALRDLVPERAKQLRGLLQRALVLGVELGKRRGRQVARYADAQARSARAQRLLEGGRRQRAHAGIGRALGKHVVEQRGVRDRARQGTVDGKPLAGVEVRRQRQAPALALEPEEQAVGGWKADRAAAVGAKRRS